jgi:hypothetical protein
MTTNDGDREQRLAELRAMEQNTGRFWIEHDNARDLSRVAEVVDPTQPWERVPRSEWVAHDEAVAIRDRLLRGESA